MRTLVHLSDLHFGRVDRVIADALLHRVRDTQPDVIAVSGDFTQRARRWQFRRARAFLDALPPPHVVVPGNHDVPLYDVAARFLDPLGGYRRFITPDLAPRYGDGEVLVLGVNTTRSFTIKNGIFRARDLERICDALRRTPSDVVKVIVAHHPFEVPDAVETLTRAGADLFLTGHLHTSSAGHSAARYKCGGPSAVVVEAGTAISTRERGEANAFNVLRVDAKEISVERHVWDGALGAFVVADVQRFTRGPDGWQSEDGGAAAVCRLPG
jgi:3',5'-cyclic AMP phosphodiesterase CpdA